MHTYLPKRLCGVHIVFPLITVVILFLNYYLALILISRVDLIIDIYVSLVKAKMRSSSWWIRFFVQTSLEENEAAIKKFEQAASKRSYQPACQVFHLNPYQ